jgi:hypothetical protein
LCHDEVGDTIVRFLMRTLCTRHLLLSIAALLFAPLILHAAPQIDTTYGPLPVFELHSGFWINLHHTLYQEARQKSDSVAGQAAPAAPSFRLNAKPTLTTAEQKSWDEAVAYYAEHYSNQDLLFSTELILLKNQVGDFEDCDELSGVKKKTCDAGLSRQLTQILDSAAPVYRAHLWPAHDRANRRWIARVAPLVREQGVGLSERLADIYQTRWPTEKIRVDVSAYANSPGAYTTLNPLRVTISSLDARNQGDEALEVLFHEASHGIAERVESAIARECRQRNKAIPRDLWHALIFYTTGEVIKPVMSRPDPPRKDGDGTVAAASYVPYAVREGLYRRGWDDYLKLLIRFWQPYLDGKTSFDDAIARMISSL